MPCGVATIYELREYYTFDILKTILHLLGPFNLVEKNRQ